MSAAPIPQARSVLAVMSCLRDSAQLSTLPAWCRGELSTAADMIAEQAAALAASEARVAELRAELDQSEARCLAMFADVAMLGVAEQSLAEAKAYPAEIFRRDAERYRWLRGKSRLSLGGFWSLPRLRSTGRSSSLDSAIDALLPKGEGAANG